MRERDEGKEVYTEFKASHSHPTTLVTLLSCVFPKAPVCFQLTMSRNDLRLQTTAKILTILKFPESQCVEFEMKPGSLEAQMTELPGSNRASG